MSNEERFQRNTFRKAVPDLPVKSCPEALTYYCEVLGFQKEFDDAVLGFETPWFAGVARGECALTLNQHVREKVEHGLRVALSCRIDDVDLLHEEYRAKGVTILRPPRNEPWGERSVSIEDLNGHELTFYCPARDE